MINKKTAEEIKEQIYTVRKELYNLLEKLKILEKDLDNE